MFTFAEKLKQMSNIEHKDVGVSSLKGTPSKKIYIKTSTEAVYNPEGVTQEYINNHVDGSKIVNGTITNSKIADSTISMSKLDNDVQTEIQKGAQRAWTPKGTYNENTVYGVNDLVYHTDTNSSYISLQANNQGHNPTWQSATGGWWMKVLDGSYVNLLEEELQQLVDSISDGTQQQVEELNEALEALEAQADQSRQDIQDIVDSLAVVQTTGQSASDVMSQKAVTDALVGSVISYDNSQSGLSADDVQGALDEVSEEYKLFDDTGYNPLGKSMTNAYVASKNWINVTLGNHSITLTTAKKQTSAYTQGPVCTILKNGKTYRIEFDYETDFNTNIRTVDTDTVNNVVLKSLSGSGHAIITHTMTYDSGGFTFLIPANTVVGKTISITNFFIYEVSNVKDVLTEVLSNITKPCELAQVGAYGMYINTNTYVWANNANNTSCYVYKVIGGTSVKMSTSSTTRVQYTFLANIDAVAGNLADFADGWNKRIAAMVVDDTVTVDVPNNAKYIYMLSLPPTWGAPKRIDGVVGDGINAVDFVGDSLTATGLSLTSPMAYFPSKVREYLGIDGFNMGVGGENAGTILGRCNGIPYKLASNVTIPSDTTKVQIYLTNIYGQHLLPLLQRYTSHTIVIDGIEGTLTTTQTNPAATTANYFFQRKESGSAYNAKAGDDIFVNDFKPTFNPHRAKIIWIGQNGGFDTNSTSRYGGNINNADDRARLIDMIKTYIAVSGCEYYMVLSAPQNTNNDLESDFAKAFGNRYFNVRMYMVNHGIDDAIALGYLSASSYPTAQDITDMNNGVVPSSLRIDNVHFTQNGFYTMAHALSIKLKEVWNL